MSAAEISAATKGVWSEEAIIEKLGIVEKTIPGPDDGTQEMGARAALDCLKNTGIDPLEIDVILCVGEEWKEYLSPRRGFTFSTVSVPIMPGHRCTATLQQHGSSTENGQGHDYCR